MSEKKGPFDAAIAVLKTELRECSPDEEDEFCDFIQSLTDNQYEKGLRIALCVLEAAGKVDIRSAQFFIDGAANFGEGLSVINSDSSRYLYQTGEKQIRALLEVLPEKEKKCIGTY